MSILPNLLTNYKNGHKKVGAFLKEINGADWVYLELVVGIRSNLENLRKRSGLDAHQFAKELNISIEELDDFMVGNYEYKLDDICAINFLAKQVAMKEAEQAEIVRVAKNDYKYSKPLTNDTEGKSNTFS